MSEILKFQDQKKKKSLPIMTCLLSGTETQFKKAVRMQNLKLL